MAEATANRHFVAYHNVEKNENRELHPSAGGPLPFFMARNKRKTANDSIGQLVWVIQGKRTGRSKQYTLLSLNRTTAVKENSGARPITAEGECLYAFEPPVVLKDQSWFKELLERFANFRWGFSEVTDPQCIAGLRHTFEQAKHGAGPRQDNDEFNALLENLPAGRLRDTVREALVKTRRGQDQYRQALLTLWGGACAVTGCSVGPTLVASHARAWADSDHRERLDPYNGVLLTANLDRLFDRGLISFTDSGELLLGPELSAGDMEAIGVRQPAALRFVREQHKPYLRAHRERHGFPG